MSIKTKNIDISNLPIELQEDFKLITFGNNYHLIGSASINSITYSGDYDLNEKLIITDKQLQKHLELIKKHKSIWLVSVHNTPDYIQINTIANINGILTDINNTIFHSNQPSKRETSISLKKDIHDLISNKDYFKAVKRLFTFLSINQKKNKKIINGLTEFLNSNIGLLSNIINQLNIILNFSKTVGTKGDRRSLSQSDEPKLIFDNLELCKLKLNKIYCIRIENKLFKMFNMREISNLIEILNNKLQAYTKDFVNLNKNLFYN